MEKEQLKAYAERLKWYIANLKNAQTELEKSTATASIVGYLEGFIDLLN